MTDETIKVVKVKKRKKGYFDNSEMLGWLRKRNKLRDSLHVDFKKEEEKRSGMVLSIIHDDTKNVIFGGREYTFEEFNCIFDKVNNEVGKLYVKVAEGMMKRPNFINYPPDQKIDMISDALFFMTRAGERYDITYQNPFGYFSQITFNSFLQSIKNMKKRISTFVCVDHIENLDSMNSSGGGDE